MKKTKEAEFNQKVIEEFITKKFLWILNIALILLKNIPPVSFFLF